MSDDTAVPDEASASASVSVPVTYDVAVVGAGPAGLAAAVTAADAGLSVALVDAAPQPGGQYWRHYAEPHLRDRDRRLHHDWTAYARLRTRLENHRTRNHITYLPNHQVWLATPGSPFTLHLNAPHEGVTVRTPRLTARSLILCTGAHDRQLPVPGWDLPGVMTAGGVQALLKGHRTLAGRRAVVAGTGPFLLPVATGLAEAGAKVLAVCEANGVTGWARTPVGALRAPSKLAEAARYTALMARHRIPYRTGTTVTAILGTDRVESVRVRTRGRTLAADADLVAFGWGFTPNLDLPLMLGARTHEDTDGSTVADVDEDQRSTTTPRLLIAGEPTGVGGASLALAEGELSALTAAADLGRPANPRTVHRLRTRIRHHRAFARAMHLAHPVPAGWTDWLTPETVVCRCEEVTHGDLCRARADLSADDPRTLKLLARPGMGWCQGRICGYATAALSGGAGPHAPTGRPLASPVCLSDLAALEESPPPKEER